MPRFLISITLAGALLGSADARANDLEERAQARFVAGDHDGAYPLLTKLVDRDAAPTWAFVYKAAAERERGELDQAAATLRRAWDPASPRRDVGLELATTLSWASRVDEARGIYERLLEFDPGDLDAATGRARMLAWTGRVEAAQRQYRAVLAVDSTRPDALAGLADAQIADARHGAAKRTLARLAEASPDDRELARLRGNLAGDQRWLAAAEAGAMLESEAALIAAARIEGRLLRSVGIYGEYAMRGLRPAETASATDTTAHVARAGLSGSVGERSGWRAGARAVIAPTTRQVFGEVGASHRGRIPLGFAATARLGGDEQGTVHTGGDATVQGSPRERWTLLAQTFFGVTVGPTPDASVAVVGGVDAKLGKRWKLGARGGWATNRAGHFGLASLGASVTVGNNVALTARYEALAGPFVRHTLAAGIETRW